MESFKEIWKPEPSLPRYTALMIFLMISPNARVTIAR